MLDSFLTFINQQRWDMGSRKTLLAVSGGIDSVVMMHLFHNAGFEVGIAHCNFGLRGQDSVEDEQFVRGLAEGYQMPFFVKSFDPDAYAMEHGVSLQMSARVLRYHWFEVIRSEFGYDWVATAHHTNDSIETILLNLTRGTGLAGLQGVPPVNGRVVRPLLFSSRAQIVAYAEKNELVWREDRTNSSIKYKRNLVRHRVVPILKELNPVLERTFQTTAERIRAADHLLMDFMEGWQKEHVRLTDGQVVVAIESLRRIVEPVYGLWFILRNYGFNYQQTQTLFSSIDRLSGKVFYSQTHKVLKDRDHLIVMGLGEGDVGESQISGLAGRNVYEWGELSIYASGAEGMSREKNAGRIFVDGSKLVFPLTIRNWIVGDVFQPFGMDGKRKKLSDLLIDLKYSIFQKRHVKVLVNGTGEIVWVIGIRADERFRIRQEAQNVVTMEVIFHKGQ
jgi:tRNA(Ile)-lysidine synthase